MKAVLLLLVLGTSSLLYAAENKAVNPAAGQTESSTCIFSAKKYSPGAIIKNDKGYFRCVAAYDDELRRIFVWARIPETSLAEQNGDDIRIYML